MPPRRAAWAASWIWICPVTVTKPVPWPSRRVIRFTGTRRPVRCRTPIPDASGQLRSIGQRQQLRSRGRWSVPDCAVGYLSGDRPDRRFRCPGLGCSLCGGERASGRGRARACCCGRRGGAAARPARRAGPAGGPGSPGTGHVKYALSRHPGGLPIPGAGSRPRSTGRRQRLRSRVAGAYLNAQSGTRPDRPADRRVGARLRRGQQSQEVIALSATGQLGTATTGQIQG
jgi:hypothetical protein